MTTMMAPAQDSAKSLTTIITDDDNSNSGANTATVFSFNSKTGVAKQTRVLQTGGTGTSGGLFAAHEVAVKSDQACVFVLDADSNDIAAFQGPSGNYAKVGNYTSSNSLWNDGGGSLALARDGKALYSANSESENISEWTINSDCSLTHLNDYVPSGGADEFGPGFIVSPNGKYLLVSAARDGYVETFIINKDDSLTDVAPYYFTSFPECSNGCWPSGIAIASDGKAIVVANANIAITNMFAANVDCAGKITNQTLIDLSNGEGLLNPEAPVLDDSKAGTAQGYMSMAGWSDGLPAGIIVFSLNEKKLGKSKILSVTRNYASPEPFYGNIRNMGTWIIQAAYPNTISAFQIKCTKLGKQVNSNDPQGVALLSFDAF